MYMLLKIKTVGVLQQQVTQQVMKQKFHLDRVLKFLLPEITMQREFMVLAREMQPQQSTSNMQGQQLSVEHYLMLIGY